MTAAYDYTIRYKTDRKTKAIKAEIYAGNVKAYGTVWCGTKAAALTYAMGWLNNPNIAARTITEE